MHPLLSLQAQWRSLPREPHIRCMRWQLHPIFGHTSAGLWQALWQNLRCTAGKGELRGGRKSQSSVTQYTCLGYKHLPCKTVLQHKSGNNRTPFIGDVNINHRSLSKGREEKAENYKVKFIKHNKKDKNNTNRTVFQKSFHKSSLHYLSIFTIHALSFWKNPSVQRPDRKDWCSW